MYRGGPISYPCFRFRDRRRGIPPLLRCTRFRRPCQGPLPQSSPLLGYLLRSHPLPVSCFLSLPTRRVLARSSLGRRGDPNVLAVAGTLGHIASRSLCCHRCTFRHISLFPPCRWVLRGLPARCSLVRLPGSLVFCRPCSFSTFPVSSPVFHGGLYSFLVLLLLLPRFHFLFLRFLLCLASTGVFESGPSPTIIPLADSSSGFLSSPSFPFLPCCSALLQI